MKIKRYRLLFWILLVIDKIFHMVKSIRPPNSWLPMSALSLKFTTEEIGNSNGINLYDLSGAFTLLFSVDSIAFHIIDFF